MNVVIIGKGTIGGELASLYRDEGHAVIATTRKQLDPADGLKVREFFRDKAVDILINTVGYSQAGALETVNLDQVRKQFDVNLFSHINVLKEVIPKMRSQGFGIIMEVSSSSGIRGRECCSVYCSSKFALEGLMESLYLELKHWGIRVKIAEPPGTKGAFRDKVCYGATGTIYDSEHERLKSYFREGYNTLMNPRDVAVEIKAAIHDGTDQFRYPIGAAKKSAQSKWRDYRYPFREPLYLRCYRCLRR